MFAPRPFSRGTAIRRFYRIHEGPTAERLTKLRDFLGTFGLQLGGGDESARQGLRAIVGQVARSAGQTAIANRHVAFAAPADLQSGQRRSFGLAYESYTHFTSPFDAIRICSSIAASRPFWPRNIMSLATGPKLGCTVSTTERRADEASR